METEAEPAQDLAATLGRTTGRRNRPAAIATYRPGIGVTLASANAAEDADYELGSISKGITGLLYADALTRGELTPETTLADALPLGDCPAGAVRLSAIATHRSGLPRLPEAAEPWKRTLALWRHGTNPYGETVEELLLQVRPVTVGPERGVYSNLGYELLGHAVAVAAGMPYAQLLRERICAPLGLAATYAPAGASELRPSALAGRTRRGRPREAWTGEAIAPAGGIRSTIGDLGALMAALVEGTAPGIGALDPVAPMGRGARIGAAWVTYEVDGRTLTWHNGATGGFRSFLGIDRTNGHGVAVLSAASVPVTGLGFRTLRALAARR